jgi:hypothetical protein
MNLDGWPKVLAEVLKVPTQSSLSLVIQCPKEKVNEKLPLMDILWYISVQTKLKHTESASLWVAT